MPNPDPGVPPDPLLERVRRALAPTYDVESRLGGGGMATVFRGVNRRLARPVAIKVLFTDVAKASTVERFRREARILARLEHPGVIRVYDAGESEETGLAWYTMDIMRDGALEQRLATGPLPLPEALRVGRELASALGAAHAAGVIHRDIKPGNIFFSGSRVVLGDFGVASVVSRAADEADSAATLTDAGSRVGTLAYMAPELIYGGNADERSDLWGLGATLYEMTTGTRWSLVDEQDPWSGVPPAVRPALKRALANDPRDRWPSASAFAQAWPRSAHRRWPRLAAVTALALAGVPAAGLWSLRRYLDPPLPHGGRPVPVAAHLAVVPFEGDGEVGRRLSRYTVQSLEWYPLLRTAPFVQSAAIASEARATGVETGGARLHSAFYVTGEILGASAPRSLRLEVRDSTDRLHRVLLVPDGGDDVAWGAAAADSILSATWPAHVVRFRELSRRGTTNPAAAAAFVGCDDAFQLDDWQGAERSCNEAIELDSLFPQALWTLALVHRWMRVPFADDLRRLGTVITELPKPYARLVSAQASPELGARIDSFGALAREYPTTSVASFLEYNERFHRGPLLGMPLSATVAEMQQRSDRDAGLWRALGDQLLWGYIRLGDRRLAERALQRRLRLAAGASGESADRARLLRLAFWARFEPFRAGLAARLLMFRADSATVVQLGRVFRFGGVPFDAPGVQRYIGARLSGQGLSPAARGAGALGEAVALVALGQPEAALARLKAGEELRGAPDSSIASCEWRLALATVGFLAPGTNAVADCRRTLFDRLADPRFRTRAAVVLSLDAASHRDRAALAALDRALRPAGDDAGQRVGKLIRAELAAVGGRFSEALDSTRELRSDDLLRSAAVGPFARATLFLSRGEWQAATGDSAAAAREWHWYENSDFESWPEAAIQSAEVDAMLAGMARLRRAEVTRPPAGGQECRDVRRVLELWRNAEPELAHLKARTEAVARRCPA